MKAAMDTISAEFEALHCRYLKANKQMALLQATAIEGIRKIGVGCITEESRAEFVALQKEIMSVLTKMKEICDTLHEVNPKPD
jgi:hypothetical protein